MQHSIFPNSLPGYPGLDLGALMVPARQVGGDFYARAGHKTPLLLDDHNKVIDLPYGLGQPLGIFKEFAIDAEHFVIPDRGSLIIYSDRLSETIDDNLELPRLSQLCATLLEENKLSAQALCDQLWRSVGGSMDTSLIHDDFTVVVVKSTLE